MVRWLLCNDIIPKAIPLSQRLAQCAHFARHAKAITLTHPSINTLPFFYKTNYPSRMRDGWRCVALTGVDETYHQHSHPHNPTTNTHPPFQTSFNPHSTRPCLRPYRDNPHPSLPRLCGWHAIIWYTDRSPQTTARKTETRPNGFWACKENGVNERVGACPGPV